DLSGDADDVFLDEASGRVYVACGVGFLDVFRRGEEGAYEAEGRIAAAGGSRTCLYSPGGEKLYVAVPHRGDQRAEIRVYDARPRGTPGDPVAILSAPTMRIATWNVNSIRARLPRVLPWLA